MNDLRAELDKLEDAKLDYVIARCQARSDSEGYRNASVSKAAFYGWPADERDKLNALAQKLKREVAFRALMKIQDAAEDAADVKVSGLKSRNEHIKQSASTEILDRILGKPTQSVRQDITSDGEKITVTLEGLDD